MKTPATGPIAVSGIRRRLFACFIGGFLVAPVIPVEFTSLLTGMVWCFSGGLYALVFSIVGTFGRPDSLTIYSGLEDIMTKIFHLQVGLEGACAVVLLMFLGNVGMGFMFKAVIFHTVSKRLPNVYLVR